MDHLELRHQTFLFPALLRVASPTIFLGAGEGRRAGLEGLETRREISDLPGPSSKKLGSRVNARFITPVDYLSEHDGDLWWDPLIRKHNAYAETLRK